MKILKIIAAIAAVGAAAPAMSAVLIVEGGILKGAKWVKMDFSPDATLPAGYYDVAFVDGTCAQVFSGCDESSDFTFKNESDALGGYNALRAQIFRDGPAGNFNSHPNITNGCVYPDPHYCIALMPYLPSPGNLMAVYHYNVPEFPHPQHGAADISYDTSPDPSKTWAVFTPTAVVPEPATWAMIISGFGLIGGLLRSRKYQVSYG